jgi:hypothetical protein
MHSSREDQSGKAAGQFQTNVYTKKRRKLKIGREIDGERFLAGASPNVDLGQMVPSEYLFDVIQAHYPTGNLYRGHTAHSIMK